jgi:hypothetical protein
MRNCAASLAGEIARAPVTNAAQRALRAQVAATLARQHAAYAAAFADALLQSFAEFTRPPEPKAPGQWLNLGDLEIMDDARIQDEIEVAQIVHILAESCGVELRRLLKFEEALRRSEGVRVAASPIGPPGLARALWAGAEGLDQGAAARVETVRCAARWFAPRLSEIYAALRQSGFADASHLEAADRAATPLEDAETTSPPTGFDVTRPGALYELLDLDDQRPVFAASEAPALQAIPDTLPMPLDGEDARIPGLIHSHREELVALQDATSARLAVALIGHLFAQIVADASLSPEARAGIGRLQPAVVRLATQDATLLQSHRHPVWMLVNRIATTMGTDKGAPAPEFLQWLAATVAQVDAEPTAAAFEAAGERLTQWQRQQAQSRLTDVEGALDLLRRNAAQEALVARVRARLQRKLDSAQPPSAVKRFILTLWSLVVAQEVATRASEAPGGAPRTSPAMDTGVDLIWSTDAARSRADAPTLVGLIPELVERLTAGMATVQLSGAIRTAWLDQLAAIHLHVLRRPAGTAPTSGPVTVDLELDDELPPAAPAPRAIDPADPLGALQVGASVAMQLHGDWLDVQLLWLSDNGQFLLFSGTNGGSHSFTRTALHKMLEQGLLRTSEARSALERASDEIIRRRH